MTTLAIIGNGIMGSSLLYSLSESKSPFDKILVFSSEKFAPACSLSSTAIVAPRGVTVGHSPLGDLIKESYDVFAKHIHTEAPDGVFQVTQFTGAMTNLDQFKSRYPSGQVQTSLRGIDLKKEIYFTEEKAFLIDPALYLHWLKQKSSKLPVTYIEDFVTEVSASEQVLIKTQKGQSFKADQLVFTTGSHSCQWRPLFKGVCRPVQGSYLEFHAIDWDLPSFSLTLEGMNLIHHRHTQKILIGSTTHEVFHRLPEVGELQSIHQSLSELVQLKLPDFEKGLIKTGHREKSQKRLPYLLEEGPISFVGGLYKNGFSFALRMARLTARQLLERAQKTL